MNDNSKSVKYKKLGQSIGFALGVAYGFKVKSGFLKGFGYAILGSLVLGSIGQAVGNTKAN